MARRLFQEFTLEGRPVVPNVPVIPQWVEERYVSRLPPGLPDGCWELARCISRPPSDFADYSVLRWQAFGWRYSIQAHRYAYLREHGSIPPGLMVLHRCNNKRCVRPDHLYAGDNADNVADIWRDPVSVGRYLDRAMRSSWSPEAKDRARVRAAALGIVCDTVEVPRAA